MGEEATSLLEAVVDTAEPVDEVRETAPKRRLTRRTIAVAVVGALVIAGGTVGGIAWANRVAHDQAISDAEAARATAAHATAAQRATVVWLETAVAAGIASRDAVATSVLSHQDLLGGAEAVAPVVEERTALEATLVDLLEVDAPTAETAIPDAVKFEKPAAVDPELTTDELTALAISLAQEADDADAARLLLATRAAAVDADLAALGDSLENLASAMPTVLQSLLNGHALAPESTKAQAMAALTALGDASGAGLPALFDAYAAAASGVVAAHEAEAARIAAEAARVAAEQAAKKARPSSRGGSTAGGGGGGTEQRGVLGETNAQRASNSLGALSWNGTLASRSCAFAAELAASNGALYHSSFAGGFSRWGENVAYGYGSASAVVAGWMASSGHRANILGSYTVMGACSATSSTGRVYWVQQFGA